MAVSVRVGGVRLESRWPTAQVQDSTIFRNEGWSGDYQAQCSWGCPPSFQASWLRKGAIYEHLEGGRTWAGLVSEIELSDDGITIHAYGFGSQTDDYRAVTLDGLDLVPSAVPDDAFDYAVDEDGMTMSRFATLGTASVTTDIDDELTDLTTLLDRRAKELGKRWVVDSFPEITLVSDPVTPTWIISPRSAYLGTADDQYVTHLYGLYVVSVDGTTGLPDGYGVVVVGDDEMAIQFDRKAYTVDLTPLGILAEADAEDNVAGRFALIGARMGWTNGIEITAGMLRRLGGGNASPMSMHGANGAGSMLRVPGITDTRSQPTTRGAIDIVLGEVTRFHDEQRVAVTPVGYAPRDFQSALAPAERPKTEEAA